MTGDAASAAPQPSFTELRIDTSGRVGVVVLDRPARRNAWTVRLAVELDEALRRFDADPDIAALVVTGTGDAFSVGADLASGSITHPGGEQLEPPAHPFLPSHVRKPVVAALNGHAVGAGITFSLHCDYRILAADGKVGFPFVRRGVVAEMGAHWLLPRITGLGVATDLLLTGRIITAAEALEMGVVHRVVDREAVLPAAMEIAETLAEQCAPRAMAGSKALLWGSMGQAFPVAAEHEVDTFQSCAAHPDAAEGVASFLEKRPPRWTGHLKG